MEASQYFLGLVNATTYEKRAPVLGHAVTSLIDLIQGWKRLEHSLFFDPNRQLPEAHSVSDTIAHASDGT